MQFWVLLLIVCSFTNLCHGLHPGLRRPKTSPPSDDLPSLSETDEHLISNLLSKFLNDPEFIGHEVTVPWPSHQSPLKSISNNTVVRNPFEGLTAASGRDGLLPGFVETFQRISQSFLEEVIRASQRILTPNRGNQNSTSGSNQITSVGSNSIGIGEGDIPHRPVSANGRPTGVEPPRPEKNPDVSSVSKVPASIVNQTTNVAQAGSGQ